MPYTVKQIVVKSSIDYENNESEEIWDLKLSQENDIYFYIEKTEDSEEDLKIEKIYIENIQINNYENTDNIKIYLATGNTLEDIYEGSEEKDVSENLEFTASTIDDVENQKICEDGGMICFRISNINIGEYVSSKDTELVFDGSILEKCGTSEEDIKFNVSFDFIIETSDGVKYKTTLSLELPVDNFEDSGTKTKIIDDFSDVVFKRE